MTYSKAVTFCHFFWLLFSTNFGFFLFSPSLPKCSQVKLRRALTIRRPLFAGVACDGMAVRYSAVDWYIDTRDPLFPMIESGVVVGWLAGLLLYSPSAHARPMVL